MVYNLHALLGAVAEEVDRCAVEVFLVGVGVNDVCLYAAHFAQGAVVDSRIYFHAACVEHGAEQCSLLHLLAQQHWHCHQLECRHCYELQVLSVADALCHRHSDAQSGVRTGTAAHGYGVERYGMAVGERHCLVYIYAEIHGVVRTFKVFFGEYTRTVLTDGN